MHVEAHSLRHKRHQVVAIAGIAVAVAGHPGAFASVFTPQELKCRHIEVRKDIVHFDIESGTPEEILAACQVQVHACIGAEHIRIVVVVLEATRSVAMALDVGRSNFIVVQRTMQCRVVRNDDRYNRVLARIVAEVRKDVQAGIRFPREGLATIQFVFTVDRAHVRRHREMVRSLELKRSRGSRHPGEIDRGHIVVLRIRLGHRQERIRIVAAKARTLRHQVLGIIAQAQLAGHARFQASRQVAIIVIRFPVATVSRIRKEPPVGGINLRKVLFKVQRCRWRSLVFTRIGNGADRKNFLREVTPPVHAGSPRKHSRLEVIGLRIAEIGIFTFDNMMFIEQGAAQFGSQDRALEIPVESTTQSRMRLFVGINKCRRFLCVCRAAETRRIAERITQNFTHEAGMSRRSKAGIIFGAHDQVLLLAFDNVN